MTRRLLLPELLRRIVKSTPLVLVVGALCVGFVHPVPAQEAGAPEAVAQKAMKPGKIDIQALQAQTPQVRLIGPDGTPATVNQDASEVERYCLNIADKAQDARYAIQQQQLKDLHTQLEQAIADLEAKRQEYQDWLKQRQEFIDQSASLMVDIYAKMPSDAAAQQLASLNRKDAAAILAKLKSRTSSAIMGEMPTKTAAEIANVIIQTTVNPDAPALTTENKS
ncbi:MotE family protein [Consotaella salsifontis]|uniref:Flagellar motility protein MotE, a chaperone for MotC folding n=1 Tax=Consotaella salsifontis TaxID=1365950 RepID=A0A1T4NSS9_9HYPH|nr:MotE family protein [Consotaella salsifontis]SJZ81758.1 Flagellar motility protein MotE, a chaperone for MotC folding [Consotaella salsifontis]